jgi:hypothetical protein
MPKPTDRTPSPSRPQSGAHFRKRYEELEARRSALISRLTGLGDKGRAHVGYKRALKLLNDTFRKSSLVQRVAILEAAAWLIDILERLTQAT